MAETVWLERPGNDIPWGFRLHGGCDFHVPLTVQKVTAGSVAATGLNAGDVITSIGGAETASLTHAQAMQTIKDCGNSLQLTVSRSGVGASGGAAVYPTAMTSPTVVQAQTPPRFDTHQQQQQQQPFATNYSDTGYSSVGSPMQTSEYPFAGDSTYQNSYTNGGGPPSMTTSTSDLYDSMLSNPDYYDSTLPSSQEPSVGSRQPSGRAVAQSPQPQMPDKVLNMASRVGKDKKPFAYVADVNDIQAQRDRVRKKNPVCTLPRYQHMLNMPQFEDPVPARVARSMPSSPAVQGPGTPSDTAVVANLQFNSPLGIYSGDNVVEALQGQTGGQISSVVGLPQKDKGDITQSAVYKLIHGIDQPRPRAPVGPASARSPPPKEPSATDEVKFSGFNRGEIPSKSFQRLQSWTGTTGGGQSEIDTTSIRHIVTGGGDGQEEPGQYDEKSIRYTGRNIPSRSFRMLQSMTGGDGSTGSPAREIGSDDEARRGGMRSRSETPSRIVQRPAAHHPQHPQHQQQPHQQQQPHPVHTGGSEIDTTSFRHNLLGDDSPDVGDYDQSSIRYTGNKIPSRSFRMLQQMTGSDNTTTPPVPSQPARRQPNPAQQQRRIRTAPPHGAAPAPAADGSHQQQQQQPGGDQEPAADIRYAGGHIPSQSFRILQQSIGADGEQSQPAPAGESESATTNGTSDMMQSSQGHKVKVVRLRSQASVEEKPGATEF